MKTTTILRNSILILILLIAINSYCQDKKAYIGIQIGPFIPSSDDITGIDITRYDTSGSPINMIVSGFGSGIDCNLTFQYCSSNLGLKLDAGIRILQREVDMALAPTGLRDVYENTLIIVPVETGLVYHFKLNQEKIIPYYSAGIGGYYGLWDTKHMPEDQARKWEKGSSFAIGMYHAVGAHINLYYDLLLNTEVKINFANSTWKVEDQDDGSKTDYNNMNTGGTAFKVGIIYKF